MADTFELEIATPDRLLVREQVSAAQIPASNGYLGILPNHSPLLSTMGTGELTYQQAGEERSLAVSGGVVEVEPDHVRVLVDRAERADEIDVERAQNALRRAEERLSKVPPGADIARALHSLERARARVNTAGQR